MGFVDRLRFHTVIINHKKYIEYFLEMKQIQTREKYNHGIYTILINAVVLSSSPMIRSRSRIMTTPSRPQYSAFEESSRYSSGTLQQVAIELKKRIESGVQESIVVFDDTNSKVIDLNLSGSIADVEQRYQEQVIEEAPDKPRGRGRPKLGVVGHEVTLLPRHWEWLRDQPGGASVVLRKLVEQARHDNKEIDQTRFSRNAVSRFITTMAGNLPGYEEANRALFANDKRRFDFEIELWPTDFKSYIYKLAVNAFPDATEP